MDVVRLVEEVKECCDGLTIENDDVFMNTKFSGRFLQHLLHPITHIALVSSYCLSHYNITADSHKPRLNTYNVIVLIITFNQLFYGCIRPLLIPKAYINSIL